MKSYICPLFLVFSFSISAELLKTRDGAGSGISTALTGITAERNHSISPFQGLSFASLIKRQLECEIPTDHDCGEFCCGETEKCCPIDCCPLGDSGICCSDSIGGCCSSTENCVTDVDKCCDKDAETCAGDHCYEAGAVCCNDGTTACSSGQSCCGEKCCVEGTSCCADEENCCEPGEICCPGTCCPEDSECSDTYGYCRETLSSTSVSSASSSSKPSSSSPLPSSISTPKISTISTISSSSSSSSTGCLTVTAGAQATASNLPVMEFVYFAGVSDDIPKNICLGMRYKLGQSVQEMVLTYAGDGQKCSRPRGRQSGCPSCCNNVKKVGGPYNGERTTCDEFPFKSTGEGGRGAWISCVVDWENTAQGHYLGTWYSQNVKAGDQFIVRVKNLDCSTVQVSDLQGCGGAIRTKVKRDDLSTSGYESTIRQALDNSSNLVVIPFGDLDVGTYSTRAQLLSGHLSNISVIDNDGEEIAQPSSLDALYSDGILLNWNSDGYVSGVGIVGVTEDTSVNISYQFAVNSTLPSTTPVPTATRSLGASLKISWSIVLTSSGLCSLLWLL